MNGLLHVTQFSQTIRELISQTLLYKRRRQFVQLNDIRLKEKHFRLIDVVFAIYNITTADDTILYLKTPRRIE